MRGFTHGFVSSILCVESWGRWVFLSLSQRLTVLLSTFCFKGCHAGSQLLSLLYIGLPSLICQTLYSFHLLHSFHFLSCDEASWKQLWGSMVEMHQSCSAGRSGWASYTPLDLNWHISYLPCSQFLEWHMEVYYIYGGAQNTGQLGISSCILKYRNGEPA